MSDKIDELNRTLSELSQTVKEHDNMSTLDLDALAATIEGVVEEKVQAEMDEAEANKPQRAGDMVGPEGAKVASAGYITEGKFEGHKVDDVIFAKRFIDRARAIDPRGAQEPSKELEETVTKLMGATTAGAGDEWVPTGMSAELWADAFLQSRVVANLPSVNMPTNPYDVPTWGTAVFRKAVAGEAAASQNITTAKSTLTATELIADIAWEYDLDEDSVIAMLPAVRAELSRAGSEYMDSFALNADATAAATGNINLDDATPATDAYYLSGGQDGIRHYYLVDATGQSANISTTLTDALFTAGVGKLGKYGAIRSDVVAFTDAKTYVISLQGLTQVRTLDVYGPSATILTGQLGDVSGIPIIVSASMALAEDDGKVSATAANNDEGQIALVSRANWKVGFKRGLMIEVDRDIRRRQYIMVASFRIAIAARDGAGANRTAGHTAGIHGITFS